MRCFITTRSQEKFTLLSFLTSLLMAPSLMAWGQAPNETPSAEVSANVQARALQFLRAVERLSPHKDPNDPDASQAVPRANVSRFRNTDNTIAVTPRPLMVNVVGGGMSGKPLRGRYWTVSYFQGSDIRVDVDSVKGGIKSFLDSTLTDAMRLLPVKEWADCISEDAAYLRSMEYLRATGMDLSDVVLNAVQPHQDGNESNPERRWDISFVRLHNNVPLRNSEFWVELDASEGRLIAIGGTPDMAPIEDGQLNITQDQALARGRNLLQQKGNNLFGETNIQLRYLFPNNTWTAKSQKETTWIPTYHLAWEVSSYTGDTFKLGHCFVWIDTTAGDIVGYGYSPLMGKRGSDTAGEKLVTLLGRGNRLVLTPLNRAVQTNKHLAALSPKKQGIKTLAVSPSPVTFYGALSGLIQARSLPKHLTFRPTHNLTISLANGESKTLLFDKHTGYMLYSKGSEKLYLLPGPGLRRWMTP